MNMKEVSIEITHDCALKCIFCSSSAEHPSPIGELSFDTVKEILCDAISCGASLVSISGGEPLLHKDIINILAYCRELDLEVYLYCSGVIFDNYDKRQSVSKDFWEEIYLLLGNKITIVFDVQSYHKKNVEFLNDVPDSFELIIESIRNAQDVGISCEIHIVPMKQNYKEIPAILEFSKSIGITRVSFLRFVPQGRGIDNANLVSLSEAEFYELQAILYEANCKYGDRFIRLGHPIDFMFCIDRQCEINSCRGGNDAPLILPNGDVHMCPAWKQLKHLSAGNIYQNSLFNIWNNSDFYIKFRELIENPELIQGQCKSCAILGKCKGGCTAQRILLFSDVKIEFPSVMYLSPDPYCPLVNNYNLKKKFDLITPKSLASDITIFNIVSLMNMLHNKKTAMYGNAWRKRGEIISIMSNISRKYDRIQNFDNVMEVSDGETIFDTIVDLCIYCVKYMTYLVEQDGDGFYYFTKDFRFKFNDKSEYIGDGGVKNFFDLLVNDTFNSDIDKFEVQYFIDKIGTHYEKLEKYVLNNNKNNLNSYYLKLKETYQIALFCILCILQIASEKPNDFYRFEALVKEL